MCCVLLSSILLEATGSLRNARVKAAKYRLAERRRLLAKLEAMLNSQGRRGRVVSKRLRWFQARRKVSWATSSASSGSPRSRYDSRNTASWCASTKGSQAAASPFVASRTNVHSSTQPLRRGLSFLLSYTYGCRGVPYQLLTAHVVIDL